MTNVLCHVFVSANFLQDKLLDSLLLFLRGVFVYFNKGQWETGKNLPVHFHSEL